MSLESWFISGADVLRLMLVVFASSLVASVRTQASNTTWNSAEPVTNYSVTEKKHTEATTTEESINSVMILVIILLALLVACVIGMLLYYVLCYCVLYKNQVTDKTSVKHKPEGLIRESWNSNLHQSKATLNGNKVKAQAADYLPASLNKSTKLASLKTGKESRYKDPKVSKSPHFEISSPKESSGKQKSSKKRPSKGRSSSKKGSSAKGSSAKRQRAKGSRPKGQSMRGLSIKGAREAFTTKAVKLKLKKGSKPKADSKRKKMNAHSTASRKASHSGKSKRKVRKNDSRKRSKANKSKVPK